MDEAYRQMVDTFGRGWERGDVDELVSVFAPDAVFLETPFSERADVAGPWFAIEFRCLYRRRRTGERIDARGAMFCETKDGKITEMRMYWHRSGFTSPAVA